MVEAALPADLRDEAEATGLRLAACVRHVVRAVVGDHPTAHDLSFALKLDGVIAKRIVRLARPGMTGAEALTRAPSASNLRLLADRCAAAGAISPLDLDALRDAIARFDALIRRAGPSKAALTTLLRARVSLAPTDEVTVPRRSLHLGADNIVRELDDASAAEPWGVWTAQNILAVDMDIDALLALPGPRIICWSGHPRDDLFERSPESWSADAFERLCGLCARLAPRLRSAAKSLLLRPHARHVLCDAARCAAFIRDHARPANWPIALALDPMALIEDDMQGDQSDHITRTLESLGELSACVWTRASSAAESRGTIPCHIPIIHTPE